MAGPVATCVVGHTAAIYERGGKTRLHSLVDLDNVEWNREMSSKSSATISITGARCRNQTSVLTQIVPRRHELVIFRGNNRVWEGPIVQAYSTSSTFRLSANDGIEYLDGTALSVPWLFAAGVSSMPMAARLGQIITAELSTPYTVSTDNGSQTIQRWETIPLPANILPFLDVRTGSTPTTAVTDAFQMTLGDYLSARGKSLGVNYTMIGRKLLIWDGSFAKLRTVTENDFSGDFEVYSQGSDFYNIEHMASSTTQIGVVPTVGHATNPTDYFGPWEHVNSTSAVGSSTTAPSQTDLSQQARAGLYGRFPIPLTLGTPNGASLLLSPGITINQLVAGIDIPVRSQSNIRPVAQVQRLQSLKVVEDGSGETITATLTLTGNGVTVL
jgi:hypothetical protein